VDVLAFDQADLPDELRAQVDRLEGDAWPVDPAPAASAHHGHDPALDPVIMLLAADDQVLATLAILHMQVRHAGALFSAAGLSAVTTRSDARGRGHGHRLVVAARRRIAGSGADLALFTCDRPLQGFYERAGWQYLPGTVLIGGTTAVPFRSDQPGFDKVTIGDFFTGHGRAYASTFRHADVALYPGEIDKLW
jgi:GNAT superfamily N-acetyltransferase